MKPILYSLTITVIFISCFKPRTHSPKLVAGYKPVFSENPADTQVSFTAARPMIQPGKIYVKNNYIFQLDNFQGIHVFDKSAPSDLKPVGFISVKGATEISINGNNLFTNALRDLVVIDISDLQHLKLKSRVKNAFYHGGNYGPESLPVPPPEHGVFYDCVSADMGILIGWRKDSIYDYSCYYP